MFTFLHNVIPAKAGIFLIKQTPAFAGVTAIFGTAKC